MFYTIGSLVKTAYRASAVEEDTFKWVLDVLSQHCGYSCSFLTTLMGEPLELWWAPDLNPKGIMGAWSILHPNRIYIGVPEVVVHAKLLDKCKNKNIDVKTSMHFGNLLMKDYMVAMIHELTHMFQFKTSPVLFVINYLVTRLIDKIPYVNRIGVEHDARVNSEHPELESFATRWSRAYDSFLNLQINYNGDNLPERIQQYADKHGVEIGNIAIETFSRLNLPYTHI